MSNTNVAKLPNTTPAQIRASVKATDDMASVMERMATSVESDRELVRAYTDEESTLSRQLLVVREKKAEAQAQLDESNAVYELIGATVIAADAITKGKTVPKVKPSRKPRAKKGAEV